MKETSTKDVSEKGKKAKLLYGYEGAARALKWFPVVFAILAFILYPLVGACVRTMHDSKVAKEQAAKEEARTWFYGTWRVKLPVGSPMFFIIDSESIKSHILMPNGPVEVEGTYTVDGDEMEITWSTRETAVFKLNKEKDQIVTADGKIGTRSSEDKIQESDEVEQQSQLGHLQELVKEEKRLMKDIYAAAEAVQNPYSDFNTREYKRRDIANKLPKLERVKDDLVKAYKKAGMNEEAETAQRAYDNFMAGVRGLRRD